MLSSELRTYLGRETCSDVVGIIEEYVVGHARTVARLYRYYVKDISSEMEDIAYNVIDTLVQPVTKIYYRGFTKEITRCEKCGLVEDIRVGDRKIRYSICYYDGCPDDYIFYMDKESENYGAARNTSFIVRKDEAVLKVTFGWASNIIEYNFGISF